MNAYSTVAVLIAACCCTVETLAEPFLQETAASVKAKDTTDPTVIDAPASLIGQPGSLWDGVDLDGKHRGAIDRRLGHGFLRKLADAPAAINVNVFGLQNSGTELLNAMLHLNFGNQLNYYSGGSADEMTNSRHGHWMHSNIKEKWRHEPARMTQTEHDKVAMIAMIRNPLSWVQAMRAVPQDLEACVNGEDWFTRPCTHRTPGGSDSAVPAMTFRGLASVWNQWNDGYQNAAEYGFPHHLVLTYESLVRNPLGTLQHVANFLGLKEPSGGWVMPGVSSDNRDAALTNLFQKRHMERFSTKELAAVCYQLDHDLQRLYGYEDCEWTITKQGLSPRVGNGDTVSHRLQVPLMATGRPVNFYETPEYAADVLQVGDQVIDAVW